MASKKIDKVALAELIRSLDGINNDQRADLLQLLNERKRYGLVWEEHTEDVEEQLREKLPVLKEVCERRILSDDAESPNHILIEGDNLHALIALTYTHEGKVDVIYIDPPYNTGNKDFIYNDSFVDAEDGFRHSKWLSFMKKRLHIAKRLLSDRGVIFISIDDNEQANLKLLCDEEFGEKNCLAQLVWKSKSGGANDSSNFGIDHEYVLCYGKNALTVKINKDKNAVVTTTYNKIDEYGRRYALDRLDKQSLGYQSSLDFPINGPDGKVYIVEHKDPSHKKARWRWGKDTVKERYDELVFIYPYVYTKNFENTDGQKPRSVLYDERFGRTRTGSTDLTKLLGAQSIFSYPKPISLVKYLCHLASQKSSIILDFFAGSGTTLHATMQLNEEDGGKRQCILVTNNENNICEEVTYERNKRVIEGYTTPKGEQVEGLKNNNLRYYKIDFVDRDPSVTAMKKLMVASTDLLCIKQDLYEEKDTFGRITLKPNIARYFNDGVKQMLIIYNTDAIESLVAEIEKMPEDTNIITYVFSTNNYPLNADFEDVADKVSLCALPAAINNAYRNVLPNKLTPKSDDHETETISGE